MKISKILCGALLGCIVGSAFGVPTPEDRKKFCDQHPDKFVWVEKTKACIPINPCNYDSEDIRNAYCIKNAGGDMAQERYIKNFMSTSVKDAKHLKSDVSDNYIAYFFADGDYKVFESLPSSDVCDLLKEAVWAYGYIDSWKKCELYSKYSGYGVFEIGDVSSSQELEYDGKCKDVADFASLVIDRLCEGELWDQGDPKNNKTDCKITCR